MKQASINNIFQASKHYSQSQDANPKDFISTVVVGGKATPKRSSRVAKIEKLAQEKLGKTQQQTQPLTQPTQSTAAGTKRQTKKQKVGQEIDSEGVAEGETLSLTSVNGGSAKKRQGKKRAVKGKYKFNKVNPNLTHFYFADITKDNSVVQLTKAQEEQNQTLKRVKLTGEDKSPVKSTFDGMSSQTQDLIRKVMSPKPTVPATTVNTATLKTQAVARKKKVETEIPFSQIDEEDHANSVTQPPREQQ